MKMGQKWNQEKLENPGFTKEYRGKKRNIQKT
jgi:hypothetical protein